MANLFKQLTDLLLDKEPRRVGKVISVGAYTATIETLGGGVVTVTGSGLAVGQRVFYKGGVVTGTAPNLPSYEIDV